MILIVSYDISNAPNRTPFFEALKAQGPWWHYLTATWLISTTKTPEQLFATLAPLMVKEDRLLIFELGRTYNGWLPKDAWAWIEQQQKADAVRSIMQLPPLPPPPPPIQPMNIFDYLKTQPPPGKK